MFCTQCGVQLGNGARFCSQCGAPVVVGSSSVSDGATPNVRVTKKAPWMGLLIATWVLVGISVAMLVGFFVGDHQRDRSITELLYHPSILALGGSIGVLLGVNVVTIPAVICGSIAWRLRRDEYAKWATIVALVMLLATSARQFMR